MGWYNEVMWGVVTPGDGGMTEGYGLMRSGEVGRSGDEKYTFILVSLTIVTPLGQIKMR